MVMRLILNLLLCALLINDAYSLTEDQLIDGYSHAYNASGKLTKSDFRLIAKFEVLQSDWNSVLAPLVRGLRDPQLDPQSWSRTARRTLDEMTKIRVSMAVATSQIEDSSARSVVKEVDAINAQLLIAWEDIRVAVANGDEDAYRRAGIKAQQLAMEKASVAGPVLRRLKEKFGEKAVDGAIERELREMARKAGLR